MNSAQTAGFTLPHPMAGKATAPARSLLDRLVRRHARTAYSLVVLSLYLIGATALGVALAPALAMASAMFGWAARMPAVPAWLLRGLSLGLGWFVFGMTLMAVVSLYNKILPTRMRPYKGSFYSVETIPWFLHNGLFYLVRYTFLPFATLTPFGVCFLKAMGMKIGRHAFINTEYISDPALLTIGDDVVMGGSVRICAHYGGGGKLVIAPVSIGDRATLGLGCTILGDVTIGDGAVILAESVVLPGSRVGAGETWGGVPARPIRRSEMDAIRFEIRGLGLPREPVRPETAAVGRAPERFPALIQ
jgi:acetyltransferase-like isoleucine patch superfamily enzyme